MVASEVEVAAATAAGVEVAAVETAAALGVEVVAATAMVAVST